MIFEARNDVVLLGSMRITRLSDGHVQADPRMIVSNAPADEVDPAIRRHDHGRGDEPCFRVTCLLIETADRRILVDTGWGRWPFATRFPDAEPVTSHLARLGLSVDDIDTVVHTHAHPDHIGGNVVEVPTPDGPHLVPLYRRARYRLHAADWVHYTSPEWLAQSQYHATNLPPLQAAGVLDLFDGEVAIAPGVGVLPTPGHSPGHCCIVLTSGREVAVYLGDVAHHPVHLEHPEWNAVFDVLPELARDTRRWLYERLVREQPWIIGCHFVSPGVGKLTRADGRYRWNELAGDHRPA